MDEKLRNEIIEKAKKVKSKEELVKLAEENNVELTQEELDLYYEQITSLTGELSDEELDNVAGGSSCSTTKPHAGAPCPKCGVPMDKVMWQMFVYTDTCCNPSCYKNGN